MKSGVSKENSSHGVGETSHQKFFKLETPAQSETQIGRKCKICRQAQELLFMVIQQFVSVFERRVRSRLGRNSRPDATGDGMNKVGDTVVDNLVELSCKCLDGLFFLLLGCLQGIDEFQHVWMATGQSLANNLETSGHNVGSLDGNSNWQTHVCVSHEIIVTPTDCSTARNVHSVLDNSSTTLCAVLLHNRRNHHWCFVVVNNGVHQICSGNSDESITSSLGQGFLNTTKFGNWHPELFANPRVGSNRTDDLAATSSRTSW
mmetsp:Transcript_5699/g.13611  ORF Transcript_5699/g.13611 Transcript_5699/m.13611 type:complete len:261 (+) Transcript_5699:642-1424(+)